MGATASAQVIGRYAILGKIAQGGMAAVHLGRLQGVAGFSRTVAIKRLHAHLAEEPEFLSTMIDEARLAARIHHPNVVPTLDIVAEAGEVLIVMEYVRGESLARLLRAQAASKRRVPLPVVSAVVLGALQGLHAAHEATSDRGTPLGIVHRDVSPHNILVGVDGVARIIDFGVAKAAGRLQTTREGVIKGKVAYMAPEQLAGETVTPAVDVYAMGVVLWEALTGRNLFKGDADATVVVKALAGASEPPSLYAPDLPSGLDALVMTALARDADERFASASDMADMLVRVLPPALPKDVGLWVEGLARESLSRMAAQLAEIESTSGVASVPPPASVAKGRAATGARAIVPETMIDEKEPTVASQPSSLSVETPRSSLAPGRRWRPRHLAVAAGAAAAVIAIVLLVVSAASHVGPEESRASVPAASPAASNEPVPSAPAAVEAPESTSYAQLPQMPSPSASEVTATVAPSAAAPASASASTPTVPPQPPPPPKRTRAAPAPTRPPGPVRFSQPD